MDEHWIIAMQEGLEQFERTNVWYLVERRTHAHVIEPNGYSETRCMSKEFAETKPH